jgi:hypothetical protein
MFVLKILLLKLGIKEVVWQKIVTNLGEKSVGVLSSISFTKF